MAGREAELMERYCDGDRHAFDALYAAVAPRLLGYILALIGERSTAEDLLQMTFLKLHEARALYVRGVDPLPWLFTIARRTCVDEIRRRRRSRTHVGDEVPTWAEPRADLHGAAEANARHEGFSGETLAALATLPASQHAAILMTVVEERTHEEAAALVGATATAVKLRVHRAYVRLRQLLRRPA